MLLREIGERELIKLIVNLLRRGKLIADFDEDAAIFEIGSEKLAVSTDMGFMSTHFVAENPEKIGRKIATSSIADILAKGALPLYMLTAFGFPPHLNINFVRKLYRAMDNELKKYGAYIIGGDTNETKEFTYSTTTIGRIIAKPLRRCYAKEGDYVVVTGEIGSAAAGYLMKKLGLKGPKHFIDAQLEPRIDFKLCKKIIPHAHAGIDISDGLAFELGEISRLSQKKIVIEFDKLPINPQLLPFCEKHRLDWKKVIFHMGEDYQIVYTLPKPMGIIIERVLKGKGVFLIKDGETIELERRGYEHFVST